MLSIQSWHDGNFDLSNDNYESGQITLSENTKESFKTIGYLSDITEQQASEIVASLVKNNNNIKSYIHTLHSLIKSKGYHLFENTCKKPKHYELWAKYGDFTQYGKSLSESVHQWKQSDKKTFYNPVIFKIS